MTYRNRQIAQNRRGASFPTSGRLLLYGQSFGAASKARQLSADERREVEKQMRAAGQLDAQEH
jgi:hypothetical protein